MIEHADENQPIEKPIPRKAEQRNRTPDPQRKQKADRPKRLKPDQIEDNSAPMEAPLASSKASRSDMAVGSPELSPREAAMSAMELHEAAIASMEPYPDEPVVAPIEASPCEAAASNDAV
ncbi:MAG: hypothetical protein ACREDL_00985, partial [Bradyrhizobium sp.]